MSPPLPRALSIPMPAVKPPRSPNISGKPESLQWLIWSNEHRAWWRPNSMGYTIHRAAAGRYTWAEALDIVEGANSGLDKEPNEAMVPVHEVV